MSDDGSSSEGKFRYAIQRYLSLSKLLLCLGIVGDPGQNTQKCSTTGSGRTSTLVIGALQSERNALTIYTLQKRDPTNRRCLTPIHSAAPRRPPVFTTGEMGISSGVPVSWVYSSNKYHTPMSIRLARVPPHKHSSGTPIVTTAFACAALRGRSLHPHCCDLASGSCSPSGQR